jgi:hypothetical protein
VRMSKTVHICQDAEGILESISRTAMGMAYCALAW